MKPRVVNSRLRLLLLIILLTFAALGARAAWIQTVRASSLTSLAQRQAKVALVLPAGRGTIYDRLGTPLAIGEQATDVVAVNVAVLRVNMGVSRLEKEQLQLQAQNQALASQVSSARAAPRIEQAARRLGLVPASATDTSYLDLARR